MEGIFLRSQILIRKIIYKHYPVFRIDDPVFPYTGVFVLVRLQQQILGNALDKNGVLIKTATDEPGYFAVGFQSEKSNHKYRYVWLYKVRSRPTTYTLGTKEGSTINRQTQEVEWTAVPRIYDGQYQAVADEGENDFTAEDGATFLSSVYEADFSASTGG